MVEKQRIPDKIGRKKNLHHFVYNRDTLIIRIKKVNRQDKPDIYNTIVVFVLFLHIALKKNEGFEKGSGCSTRLALIEYASCFSILTT